MGSRESEDTFKLSRLFHLEILEETRWSKSFSIEEEEVETVKVVHRKLETFWNILYFKTR